MQIVTKDGIIIATHSDDQGIADKYPGAAISYIPDSYRYDVPKIDEAGEKYTKPRAGDPDIPLSLAETAADDDATIAAIINARGGPYAVIKALILALNNGDFVPGSNYTNQQIINGLKARLGG